MTVALGYQTLIHVETGLVFDMEGRAHGFNEPDALPLASAVLLHHMHQHLFAISPLEVEAWFATAICLMDAERQLRGF